MARVATKKQRGFAKDYIESGNGTQAALKNYDTTSKDVAKSIASENLTKPNVRALIDGYAIEATMEIQSLGKTAKNEAVRLNANKDQLDRAGYNTVDKTMNVNVEVDAPLIIKQLNEKLNALYRGTDKPSDGVESGIVGVETSDKE
jgi:phage terminase small subunit